MIERYGIERVGMVVLYCVYLVLDLLGSLISLEYVSLSIGSIE